MGKRGGGGGQGGGAISNMTRGGELAWNLSVGAHCTRLPCFGFQFLREIASPASVQRKVQSDYVSFPATCKKCQTSTSLGLALCTRLYNRLASMTCKFCLFSLPLQPGPPGDVRTNGKSLCTLHFEAGIRHNYQIGKSRFLQSGRLLDSLMCTNLVCHSGVL